MYLTAHRLYQSGEDSGWINVFYHVHGDAPLEGVNWGDPDVALIAERFPGKLIGALTECAPGGNPVDSYLDIATRDATPRGRVEAALDSIRNSLPTGRGSKQWMIDQVAIRVYFGKHIESRNIDTFDAFRDRLVKLLRNPRRCSWKGRKKPLIVEVTSKKDGTQYKLTRESVIKIQRTKGRRWAVPIISVSHNVKKEFETTHGDLRQAILETVTGLNRSSLLDHGGVVFKDLASGADEWEWPPIHWDD
jgi:hypothetical protein